MNKLGIFIGLSIYMILSTFIIGLIVLDVSQGLLEEQEYSTPSLGGGTLSFNALTGQVFDTLLPYSILITLFYVLPFIIWVLIGLSFINTIIGSVDVGG